MWMFCFHLRLFLMKSGPGTGTTSNFSFLNIQLFEISSFEVSFKRWPNSFELHELPRENVLYWMQSTGVDSKKLFYKDSRWIRSEPCAEAEFKYRLKLSVECTMATDSSSDRTLALVYGTCPEQQTGFSHCLSAPPSLIPPSLCQDLDLSSYGSAFLGVS